MKDYSVVAGSFGVKANAEGLKDWLDAQGYQATIAFNADNAMDIIRYEVGRVFEQVLEDAGVFKRDKQGKEAFARFVEHLG